MPTIKSVRLGWTHKVKEVVKVTPNAIFVIEFNQKPGTTTCHTGLFTIEEKD